MRAIQYAYYKNPDEDLLCGTDLEDTLYHKININTLRYDEAFVDIFIEELRKQYKDYCTKHHEDPKYLMVNYTGYKALLMLLSDFINCKINKPDEYWGLEVVVNIEQNTMLKLVAKPFDEFTHYEIERDKLCDLSTDKQLTINELKKLIKAIESDKVKNIKINKTNHTIPGTTNGQIAHYDSGLRTVTLQYKQEDKLHKYQEE